ncbi:hypothetical protein [Nostoc sp.]
MLFHPCASLAWRSFSRSCSTTTSPSIPSPLSSCSIATSTFSRVSPTHCCLTLFYGKFKAIAFTFSAICQLTKDSAIAVIPKSKY